MAPDLMNMDSSNLGFNQDSIDKTHELLEKDYQSPGLQAGQSSDGRKAIELKFVVDQDLANRIRERATSELLLDPHSNSDSGTYGVSSYYLDTLERDIYYRTSLLSGTKFRFRQYDASPSLFLERKIRKQGIVSKERHAVDWKELQDRNALSIPLWSEISEFCLIPSSAVHYTRSAFIGLSTPHPFRVTIDVDLKRFPFQTLSCPHPTWKHLTDYIACTSRNGHSGPLPLYDRQTMLPSKAVVEFKFMDSMPKQLMTWLEDYKIAPEKFSKYRASVAAYLDQEII